MIELVKPIVCPQRGARGASRSQEIETRSFREEAVKHDRTGKPVVCRGENHEQPTVVCSEQTTHPRFSPAGHNLIYEEETNHDRTGKPVVCPQRGAQQFVIGDDETELDLSLRSRSFLDRVNGQVRKRQKTIFNECYRRQRKTFCDMVNVHVCQHWNQLCVHGRRITQTFGIPSRIQKISQ